MSGYEAAWKSLKVTLVQSKKNWSLRELLDLINLIEIDYKIGFVADMLNLGGEKNE